MTEEKKYQALLDNQIFIGGAADVKDMVANEKIEVVVDLRGEVAEPAYPHPDVRWIQMKLGDAAEDQAALFQQAIDTVVDEYRKGNKVAFHCNGGRGRTGAVAAGTLIALGLSDSLEDAERKVQEIRPSVMIKPAQKEALQKLFSK